MSETLLTVNQAAKRLHIHPTTARRHLRNGSLHGIKRGNLWRIPESALLKTEPVASAVSPLTRAIALIEERDARDGNIAARPEASAAAALRAVREAQIP